MYDTLTKPIRKKREKKQKKSLILTGALQELIQCSCGHGISVHGDFGCTNRRFGNCACPHTDSMVLEIAIFNARETRPMQRRESKIAAHSMDATTEA